MGLLLCACDAVTGSVFQPPFNETPILRRVMLRLPAYTDICRGQYCLRPTTRKSRVMYVVGNEGSMIVALTPVNLPVD